MPQREALRELRTRLVRLCREDGLVIRDSAVRITHVGYEGDLTRKHHRNLPLLRQAVEERPWNIYCWQHLAETLDAMCEPVSGMCEPVSGMCEPVSPEVSQKNGKRSG